MKKNISTSVLLFGFLSIPFQASACVDTYNPQNNIASRQLINNCPFAVVLSYCQGDRCNPGKPFMSLGRNQGTFIPDGMVKWRWCDKEIYERSNGNSCR